MQNTRIVILAAGKGKRMNSEEPKGLAMFKGKHFLAYILETISSLGLEEKPIIIVGYKKERIQEVFGPDQVYAEQREQLGTGHALMIAMNSLGVNDEVVFVISADQPTVSKETITKIISEHKQKNSKVTIGTIVVPDFEELRIGFNNFGRIVRGLDGTVVKIVEFKDANDEEKEIKELNPALYVFDAKWLKQNINKLKNQNVQGEYYLTDLIKMACDQGEKVGAVPIANTIEGLQPNSKEELEILEKFAV